MNLSIFHNNYKFVEIYSTKMKNPLQYNTRGEILIHLFIFLQDYIHFHVTNPKTSWAHLFSTMENAKEKFPALSDYSVSETTLEQVFISFARHQIKSFNSE